MSGSTTKFLTAAAFTAGLLASTSAFASNVTVDGVTFPVGISLPGGFGFTTQTTVETVVTAAGQSLSGIGVVQNIQQSPTTIVWTQGNNNTNLDITFQGFVARTVTAPTASTNGKISFTGGTVGVYAFHGPLPNITTAGSIATDLANAAGGNLWLSLAAVPLDASGDTLVVTIPAGTSLTTFGGLNPAGGVAFFDVTGGEAAGNFATCTFPDASAPNGCADLQFNQTSNISSSTTDFNNGIGIHVQGQAQAAFNTIPEPATLGMMGAGLLALGLFRRRSRGERG